MFKVDAQVKSLKHQNKTGVVYDVHPDSSYPIQVRWASGRTDTYTRNGKLYSSDNTPSLELVRGEETYKRYGNYLVATSTRLSYKIHFRDIWCIQDNTVCLTGGRDIVISDNKILQILLEELCKVEEEI